MSGVAEVLFPRKQKVELWIDVSKKHLRGNTEITFDGTWTTSGKIGIHARGLQVERVMVGSQPAQWNWRQGVEPGKTHVSSKTSKNADIARQGFTRILEEECHPEMEVTVPRKTGSGPCRLVIDYHVIDPSRGFRFGNGYCMTDISSPGRASTRYWLPCVEKIDARCTWELQITVEEGQMVVTGGLLRKMVKSLVGNQQRRTFHFIQSSQASALCLGLVIGKFGVIADSHIQTITYLAPEEHLDRVKRTVKFLHAPFKLFEQFLSRRFPFDALQIVFLPPLEGPSGGICYAAGIIVASTDILVDDRVVEAAVESRTELVEALAQQWFGPMGWAIPGSASDAWITAGLVDYLTDLFVMKALGKFESQCRSSKHREAVLQADDGCSPPLCPKHMTPHLAAELLLPNKIRMWRAGAILRMLQRKVGQEAFRRLVCKFLQTGSSTDAEEINDGTGHPSRCPTVLTSSLIRECHKLCGMAKAEVEAFFQRWIYSTSYPRIHAAFTYSRKKNSLEVAIKQEGTPPAHAAAQAAVDAGGALGFAGSITLRVAEVDGTFDHVLSLAGEGYALSTLQVNSRIGSKRTGSKRKRLKEESDRFPDPADDQPLTVPIFWIDLDPEEDWLATVSITQPQSFWINQVRRDTGASTRIRAIHGLQSSIKENASSGLEVSLSAVNALRSVLHDPKVFYQVRMEAALALVSLDVQGLQYLMDFYREVNFDSCTGIPKANDFENLSNYFASIASVSAIGSTRSSNGTTPSSAIDFLLKLLESNDNSVNEFDDSCFQAAIVEALGRTHPPSSQTLLRILEVVDGLMTLDAVSGSYLNAVSSACLVALSTLALASPRTCRCEIVSNLQPVMKRYLSSISLHQSTRVCALKCALQLHFGTGDGQAALQLLAAAIAAEKSPAVVYSMLRCTLSIVPLSMAKAKVSRRTIHDFMNLLEGKEHGSYLASQHLVYLLFQKLAGQPLTLHSSVHEKDRIVHPKQQPLKLKIFNRATSDVGTQPSAAGRSAVSLRNLREVTEEVSKPFTPETRRAPSTGRSLEVPAKLVPPKVPVPEVSSQMKHARDNEKIVEERQASVEEATASGISKRARSGRSTPQPAASVSPGIVPGLRGAREATFQSTPSSADVTNAQKPPGQTLKIKLKPLNFQPVGESKLPTQDQPSIVSGAPAPTLAHPSADLFPSAGMTYEELKKTPKDQMSKEQRKLYKLLKRSKKEAKKNAGVTMS